MAGQGRGNGDDQGRKSEVLHLNGDERAAIAGGAVGGGEIADGCGIFFFFPLNESVCSCAGNLGCLIADVGLFIGPRIMDLVG
jgi:hypothetical protein